jgi:hypothetical protein
MDLTRIDMSYSLKTISLAALLLISGSVLATTTTADFGTIADGGSNFNQFDLTVDGVDINVSGWSDTANFNGRMRDDDRIERAVDLDKFRGGWSMSNNDENNSSNRRCTNYSHSADNLDSCGGNKRFQDYDFFLLSFSEAVSLTQATYSWVYSNRGQQVSVAALGKGFNGDLNNKSWGGVKNNHTLSSDYADIITNTGYYSSFDRKTAGTYSTYWLVGALNSVFGGNESWEGNDGLKLATIGFDKRQPKTSVPEPSSLAIFLIALIAFGRIKRKS